ncbi:hypothetical protein LY78DRAFT_694241 [Colletotrichum sublineola]|nr:hypothetical protein LY78DRAFT_694241 [Colletotrichum sublineola]
MDPADQVVTIRSGDLKLLTKVYAHLAEYAATKDKTQVDAAVRIINDSNPAPWISSVHLQQFMQKKRVCDGEAQEAVKEFRAVYPHLDPKDLDELDWEWLTMTSAVMRKKPDEFDLSWNVLRWFLPNIATNCKNITCTKRLTKLVKSIDAIKKAYKDAVAKVETAALASILPNPLENAPPIADFESISGGDEPNNHELISEPKMRKKRRNQETGEEESSEPKRRMVNRQESASTMRSRRTQKLPADETMDELKEKRQQFMSKLEEQPLGSQSGLFRQTMLRLYQHGPGADLLEALEKTIGEEDTE